MEAWQAMAHRAITGTLEDLAVVEDVVTPAEDPDDAGVALPEQQPTRTRRRRKRNRTKPGGNVVNIQDR